MLIKDGVYLASPVSRPYYTQHVASLLYTGKPAGGIAWDVVENQAIAVARNALVERFLNDSSKYEYLLFCDNDATWDPGSIVRLVNRKKKIITGVIFRRNIPPVPTMGDDVGLSPDGAHIYNFTRVMQEIDKFTEEYGDFYRDNKEDYTLPLSNLEDGLLEIDGCGMHFCLIHRDVFENMKRAKVPYFKSVEGNAGEDFYFCQQARRLGYKIYADLTVMTGHVFGPTITIGIRHFLEYYRNLKYFADVEETMLVK